MKRFAVLAYGVIAYALFLVTFLYLLGFVGNLVVPKSLDSPRETPLAEAIFVDLLLVALFGVQHSVMARPGFKRWWTRFVPRPIERSTFVLATNLALAVMFWQWRPLGGVVWSVENPVGRAVLLGIFVAGWLLVLLSTFLINHFDLFGLRQVWLYFRGREYRPLRFATPGPYRLVRHPLYVGFMMAFWATPTMTLTHLLFAAAMTAYILIAIVFEERDLVVFHGRDYEEYRRRTPMLVPFAKGRTAAPQAGREATAAPVGGQPRS